MEASEEELNHTASRFLCQGLGLLYLGKLWLYCVGTTSLCVVYVSVGARCLAVCIIAKVHQK